MDPALYSLDGEDVAHFVHHGDRERECLTFASGSYIQNIAFTSPAAGKPQTFHPNLRSGYNTSTATSIHPEQERRQENCLPGSDLSSETSYGEVLKTAATQVRAEGSPTMRTRLQSESEHHPRETEGVMSRRICLVRARTSRIRPYKVQGGLALNAR